MKTLQAKLNIGDYDIIVEELAKNPNDDDNIDRFESYHLQFNINYYPYLLAAVKKAKAVLDLDERSVQVLNILTEKFEQRNNVYPTGSLPLAITTDDILRKFLEDKGPLSKDSDWSQWEGYINRIINTNIRVHHLPFYEWCLGQLKMNLKRHKSYCSKTDCAVEKGYQRRIQFIERKIEDSNTDMTKGVPETKKKALNKIEWLGKQKELAELFIWLRAKGWIEDFEPETIKECFTNSHSIQQYLKPGDDTDTGELRGTFEQVFTSEYSPKFHGMKNNLKKN
jgi:hypothetical protein